MNTKPFWQSKTLWLNFLVLLIAFLSLVSEQIQLTEQNAAWLVVVIGTLNMLLRVFTNKGIMQEIQRGD